MGKLVPYPVSDGVFSLHTQTLTVTQTVSVT